MYFVKRLLHIGAIVCTILLCACSQSPIKGDHPENPEKFVQQVAFDTVWTVSDSQGLGKVQMNLYPNFVMHQGQQWIAIPDYRGTMVVVDAFSGERIWRNKTKMPFSSAAGETDDAVVMGCSNGQVVAMSKENGEILWTSQVSSEVLAAPRGDAHALVALSIDSRLHGLDAKTGKEKWVYDATAPALTLRGAANPLIIQDVAFVGFANGQVGIFRLSTGQLIWLEAAATPRGRNEIERMVDIDGTIARVDNMVYVVTYQGSLLAIDLPRLEVVWSHPMSSYVGLAIAGPDLIVSDSDDNIHAIDRVSGETRWKQDTLSGKYITAPAVYERYVAVADAEGFLYALSLDNGELLGYTQVFNKDIRAPILSDSQGVIVQSHGGRVRKINITPKDN